MTSIDETREQIGNERRHMSATQRAFRQAVREAHPGDPAYSDFFGACVDYLEFILERFHAQDQSHMDTIAPLRSTFGKEDQALIDNLNSVFVESRSEIDALVAAMKRYRQEGASYEKEFSSAAHRYVDFYETTLSKQKHSIRHLVDPNYTPEPYQAHSYITEESVRTERELFQRVENSVPPDVTLEVRYDRG